jgi:hypothetical protein
VLETVVALVTPYGAYVLAESIHASGVTAVVVASIILGTQATRLTNPRVRLQLSAVFETVVFLLESAVFGLIGLQLPALFRGLGGMDSLWPLHALAIAATLMVVRVAWVFPLAAIRQRSQSGERLSWRVPAVVSWAGTRGVVPLAAALSIPLSTSSGAALPDWSGERASRWTSRTSARSGPPRGCSWPMPGCHTSITSMRPKPRRTSSSRRCAPAGKSASDEFRSTRKPNLRTLRRSTISYAATCSTWKTSNWIACITTA